jgi:hypothetical protein
VGVPRVARAAVPSVLGRLRTGPPRAPVAASRRDPGDLAVVAARARRERGADLPRVPSHLRRDQREITAADGGGLPPRPLARLARRAAPRRRDAARFCEPDRSHPAAHFDLRHPAALRHRRVLRLRRRTRTRVGVRQPQRRLGMDRSRGHGHGGAGNRNSRASARLAVARSHRLRGRVPRGQPIPVRHDRAAHRPVPAGPATAPRDRRLAAAASRARRRRWVRHFGDGLASADLRRDRAGCRTQPCDGDARRAPRDRAQLHDAVCRAPAVRLGAWPVRGPVSARAQPEGDRSVEPRPPVRHRSAHRPRRLARTARRRRPAGIGTVRGDAVRAAARQSRQSAAAATVRAAADDVRARTARQCPGDRRGPAPIEASD